MDLEWWRKLVHHLTYKQHGGSGLGWTRADVLEANAGDLFWEAEYLSEQRKAEAAAIEAKQQKK